MTKRKKKTILYGSIGAGVIAVIAAIAVVVGINVNNKDNKGGTGEVEVVQVEDGGNDNGKDDLANKDKLDRPVATENTSENDNNTAVNIDLMEYEVGKIRGHWCTVSGVAIDLLEREDGTIDGRSELWGETVVGKVDTDNKTYIKFKSEDGSVLLDIKIKKMSDDINDMYMTLQKSGDADSSVVVSPYEAYDIPDRVKSVLQDEILNIQQETLDPNDPNNTYNWEDEEPVVENNEVIEEGNDAPVDTPVDTPDDVPAEDNVDVAE